jgi:SAM-dependent methyltransferase
MSDPCPACGSTSRATRLAVATDRSYRVRQCAACGLAFTTPRPSVAQLATFYQESYFNRTEGSVLGYADYDGESWASINAGRTWDDVKVWAPETMAAPRSLLDVGGASGEFGARALGEGWDVTVCELGDSARAKAAAKGLGTVASLDEATGPYGLITMFHVLEHLIEPHEALVDVRRLVRPDGLLVIELPQWRSAGRLVRRSKWAQLRPPEHINFFTKASLAAALARAGWEVVRSTTPYPRAGSLALDSLRHRQPKNFASQAGRLMLGSVGLGGYLRTVARPV